MFKLHPKKVCVWGIKGLCENVCQASWAIINDKYWQVVNYKVQCLEIPTGLKL